MTTLLVKPSNTRHLKTITSRFNCMCTKAVVKEDPKNALKEFEKLSKIYKRDTVKKPQKPPFAKNLFLGVFDADMLAFPEVLEKEDLARVDSTLPSLKNLPYDNKELIECAKSLKLFGLQAPQVAGGRELNVTETCRFNEVIFENHDNVNLLYNEQLGLQTILKLGTERQKNKYLEDLTAGSLISAFCLAEDREGSLNQLQTTAVHSAGKWVLNGEKSFVVNGDSADLFVVFGQTEFINRLGLKENKLTAFLVERSFGGVTSKPISTHGLKHTDVATVYFNNTIIPEENVISGIYKGEEVISEIIRDFRLSVGPACTAISKTLLNKFIEHCKASSSSNMNLIESDIVHQKVSEMTLSIYAMESLTHMTSALIDQYENQDCELEAAIVKAFSAENCYDQTLKCMNFLGNPSYLPDHWCNELHRNALSYLTFHESIDSLKISIALQGLQYAGIKIQEEVNKIRNPFFHSFHAMTKSFTQRRQLNDDPQMVLKLKEYLHPSAILGANWLEYCVLRLQFATESLLGYHGRDVVTKHMDLLRLADCIIYIYAMTASISRASRSYCIGLQNSEYELIVASAFCLKGMEKVKKNVQEIHDGPFITNDSNFKKIGEKVFQTGQYFVEHPLTKNF